MCIRDRAREGRHHRCGQRQDAGRQPHLRSDLIDRIARHSGHPSKPLPLLGCGRHDLRILRGLFLSPRIGACGKIAHVPRITPRVPPPHDTHYGRSHAPLAAVGRRRGRGGACHERSTHAHALTQTLRELARNLDRTQRMIAMQLGQVYALPPAERRSRALTQSRRTSQPPRSSLPTYAQTLRACAKLCPRRSTTRCVALAPADAVE